MNNSFLIKLILSFVVGSLWITATTIIAEKMGSKIGGIIGGLPTTTLVALLFIGLTQSPEAAVEATTIIPQIVGFAGILMIIFSLFIDRGFFIALGLAMVSWFVLTGLAYLIRVENFLFSIMVSIMILIFSYYILEKRQNITSVSKLKISYTLPQILIRACFAGFVITAAVLGAKFGGPILGGIFSAFPALFVSTLFILYFSHGVEFTKAVLKTLTFSGLINVVVYTTAVRFLYPNYGLFWGTIFAYIISIFTVFLTYKVLSKRIT